MGDHDYVPPIVGEPNAHYLIIAYLEQPGWGPGPDGRP